MDFSKLRDEQFLLVLACAYSGWPEATIIGDKKAAGVISFLENKVFPRHGTPIVIVSDNGPEFRHRDFVGMLERLQIFHVPILPEDHEANGMAEKTIHLLKKRIQARIIDGAEARDLTPLLNDALFDMRFSPRTRSASPFQMIYGRVPRDPRLIEILDANRPPVLKPGDEVIRFNPNSIQSILQEKPEIWQVQHCHRGSVSITNGTTTHIVSARTLKKLPVRPTLRIRLQQRRDSAEDDAEQKEGDDMTHPTSDCEVVLD